MHYKCASFSSRTKLAQRAKVSFVFIPSLPFCSPLPPQKPFSRSDLALMAAHMWCTNCVLNSEPSESRSERLYSPSAFVDLHNKRNPQSILLRSDPEETAASGRENGAPSEEIGSVRGLALEDAARETLRASIRGLIDFWQRTYKRTNLPR